MKSKCAKTLRAISARPRKGDAGFDVHAWPLGRRSAVVVRRLTSSYSTSTNKLTRTRSTAHFAGTYRHGPAPDRYTYNTLLFACAESVGYWRPPEEEEALACLYAGKLLILPP